MFNYKTSVIIPVYNTEQYLDECIQSVLEQTQKEVEVILVDDGSTDQSYEIMCSYARLFSNVKVLRQENKKLGAARNLGMQYATGKYIYFLDSDDYIKETCLEELYNHAEANQLDFVTYDSDIFVDDMETEKKLPTYDRSLLGIPEDRIYHGLEYLNNFFLIGGAYVSACLSYYNADFLKRFNIFFEEQVYYEDNEFSLKVHCNAKRMMYLSRRLYVRRYRVNSIMTSECGIIHLQSAIKMNEKCLQVLIQIADRNENLEGVRGIIAILANRLILQMKACKKNADLYGNQYVHDLCRFFTSCDEEMLFACMGLELAFDYYCIFSMMMEREYLERVPDVRMNLSMRIIGLRRRIQEVTDKVLARLGMLENGGSKIVIYGTGDVAERIVNCYRTLYKESVQLENRVIFANTKVEQDGVYLDKYPLISINDIERYSVAGILIASTRFEYEMCDVLNELYKGKYTYITYREIANDSIA